MPLTSSARKHSVVIQCVTRTTAECRGAVVAVADGRRQDSGPRQNRPSREYYHLRPGMWRPFEPNLLAQPDGLQVALVHAAVFETHLLEEVIKRFLRLGGRRARTATRFSASPAPGGSFA